MRILEDSIKQQGEIWIVDFEPQVGTEINKTRPAVVIDADYSRQIVRMVVPITTWQDKFLLYPWFIEINNFSECGLVKKSAINCQQIKSFSQERFVRKIGNIDKNTLFLIHKKIATLFDSRYDIIY